MSAENLFRTKDYDWSLFIGHLVIEKLLKAYYIKKHNANPPFIHNLLRLAELCEIQLDEKTTDFLSVVTAFNINARYDDYKQSFRKICTKGFAEIWINNIKEYGIWIRTQLSKQQ